MLAITKGQSTSQSKKGLVTGESALSVGVSSALRVGILNVLRVY